MIDKASHVGGDGETPSVVLTKRWESVGETMISHVFWMKLAFLV
jgi:hypothetical protein